MKLTIFNGKPLAATSATGAVSTASFDNKLGALRMATGRADRFVSLCACAVHDKTFTVAYERTYSARPFIISGIYKDGEGESGGGGGTSRSRTLQAAEVDHTGWRCPYCASERHIQCHKCHATVCGGKTRRYPGTAEIFECRSSCGARGTLTTTATVEGVEPVRKPIASKPFASKPIAERLPATSANTLRIATKAPRLK